jgi:hypothetical protein
MAFDKFLPLALEDSIHDFWKERKTKKTESDDDDDIDDTKMEELHKFLVKKGSDLLNNPQLNTIQLVLGALTNKEVNSATSEYERSIEHYYETKSLYKAELFYATKERITYGEIIRAEEEWAKLPKADRGDLPPLWVAYNNKLGVQNVLDIYFGNDAEYPSFGIVQSKGKEGVIGNFILNYMFPGFTLGSPENTAYLTFDANAGVIGKIFRKFKNIFNLITPANIADSASTDFNSLENRNIYQFPLTSGPEYVFNSNYYTRPDNPKTLQPVNIKFINQGFDNKNPYGFILNINVNENEANFPFNATQKQGPSVNYLSGLMFNKTYRPQKQKSTILSMNDGLMKIIPAADNITQFPSLTTDLCMDLKRGGDYEQVNSAANLMHKGMTVIMVTIDTLCSLYSRLLAQPTIHHVSTTGLITLSRFSAQSGDPEQMKLINLQYRSITNGNKLVIMERMFTPELLAVYNRYYAIFNDFLQNGRFFDKTIKKEHASTPIEQILLSLIKIRCIDILRNLEKINQFLNDPRTNEIIAQNIPVYKATLMLALDNQSLNDNQVELLRVNDILENSPVIENFKKLLNDVFVLTPNQSRELDEGKELLDPNYTFSDQKGFKYTGESKILNFDNKVYAELFDLFNKCDKFINGSSRNRSNLYDKMSKMNYEKQINTLCETFFDNKGLGETLRKIVIVDLTDIEGMDKEDAFISAWYRNLPSELNQFMEIEYSRGTQPSPIKRSPVLPSIASPTPFRASPTPFRASPTPFRASPTPSIAPLQPTPFVAQPTPFGAQPTPFGAPSAFGAQPTPFGAQPTPFGAPSAFGARSALGARSAFGSRSGFGAPSALGAPSGFGARSALGPSSAFGAQPTPFGTVSNQYNEDKTLTGGSGDIVLFYELSDLLRKIAGIAAAFVESADPSQEFYTNYEKLVIGLSGEPFLTAAKTTVNDIRFIWENEIMSLQNKLFLNETYIYKQTDSELSITNLLSFYQHPLAGYNDHDNAMYELLFVEENAPSSILKVKKETARAHPYKSKSRTTRGVETLKGDFGQLILTSQIPAEVIILLVLTVIDNIMQNNKAQSKGFYKLGKLYQHFKLDRETNFFDNSTTWSDVGVRFNSYITAVVKGQPVSRETQKLQKRGGRKTKRNKKQTRKNLNKNQRKTKRINKKTRKY